MNSKKSIKDIFTVALSNVFNLISGILIGFLLPKVLDVTDYGYYKTFTLYASYAGMFGLGLIDGIYLKYCGRPYEQLDKREFRFFSRLIILLQSCFSVIIAIMSLIFLKNEYKFIFCATALYLFFNNIIGYYQIVSQITCRFGELSKRNLIQSLLTAGTVVILWVANQYTSITTNYRLYLFLYLGVIAFLASWYCKVYKDIIFGKDVIKPKFSVIKDLVVLGVPLLFANLCSTLIFSLDRQFVNVLYDTLTYAEYSFAYNMLALVTTVTSAIAVVLFPNLKQSDEKKLIDQYDKLISIIQTLVFVCLALYFPLCWFIDMVLPQYHNSLPVFRAIFPGLVINSTITIVIHNYYKALGINHLFFIKSIVILIVSFIANMIAYKVWGDPIAISWASVLCMLAWYVITEISLVKRYNVKYKKNWLYLLLMMSAFYFVSFYTTNNLFGIILYGSLVILLAIAFNLKNIVALLKI